MFAYSFFKLSQDALSAEDISRVRKIRELEPLQNAWMDWNKTKQVCTDLCCLRRVLTTWLAVGSGGNW